MKLLTNKFIFNHQLKRCVYPIKIIVGASGDRYPGWLSTEKSFLDITNPDHWKKYFDFSIPVTTENQIGEMTETIDGVEQKIKYYMDVPEEKIEYRKTPMISNILADHVFQELTAEESIAALKNMRRYLIDGGRIRIAVPDYGHRERKFVSLMQQIYPNKQNHNFQSMINLCRAAGFKQFQLKEYFDAGGLFYISTWYRIDGYCKRSFWYDPNNMIGDTGMFWSCLIVDVIK